MPPDADPPPAPATVAGEHPANLKALETRFLALRQAAPDLWAAFTDAMAMVTGPESDARLIARLHQAGQTLAETMTAHAAATPELPYHNRHHTAEATLAVGWLCAIAQQQGLITPDQAALAVTAMLGHDIDHDGLSVTGGVLEADAAAKTVAACRAAGVSETDCTLVDFIIRGTEFALTGDNQARAAGTRPPGPLGRTADLLRVIANEADVLASLLPRLGFHIGEALAAERRRAHDPAANSIPTFSGRLAFLAHYPWFSPPSQQVGLPSLVQAELNSFVRAAPGLTPGATAEEGAAALDRIDRATALARYHDAVTAYLTRQPAPAARSAPPPRLRFQLSLTVTILAAFSIVFAAIITFTAVVIYREAVIAAVASADHAMADLTARTAARAEALIQPIYVTVAIASQTPIQMTPDTAPPNTAPPNTVPPGAASPGAGEAGLRAILAVLPQAGAVTEVTEDGAMLQVVRQSATPLDRRSRLAWPKDATYAIRRVTPTAEGPGTETWRFLDDAGQTLAQRAPAPATDPRDTIWYRTAMNTPVIATTVLHLLPALRVPGISIVNQVAGGGAIGIDIVLDALGEFLTQQRISPRSSAFIIDDDGILIAHSNHAVTLPDGSDNAAPTWITIASSDDPILREFWAEFATGQLTDGQSVPVRIGNEDYLARLALLSGTGDPPTRVGVVVPVDDFTASVNAVRNRMVALILGAGAVGLVLIGLVASRITRPLADLTREAESIGRFELDRPIQVSSYISEVRRLAITMQTMKFALQIFGQYVPKYLVRQLVLGEIQPRLGGERRVLTVMFTDIVNFTPIAEGMDPEQLTLITSDYFERMTQTLMQAGSTIEEYKGDGIKALWNAPSPDSDHAAHACLAALRCHAVSQGLCAAFRSRGQPALETRFGISTGDTIIGNVGSSDRMAYTAMGATVNLAARVEGLNRFYDTRILVTDTTRIAAGPHIVFRRIDRVLPKGARIPTDIHELLGLRHAETAEDAALILSDSELDRARQWDDLVAAYVAGHVSQAQTILDALDPARDPALHALYTERLKTAIAAPPGPDWNGVIRYTEK